MKKSVRFHPVVNDRVVPLQRPPLPIYENYNAAEQPPSLRERLTKRWYFVLLGMAMLGVIGYGLYSVRQKLTSGDEEEIQDSPRENQNARTARPLKSILKKKSKPGKKFNKQDEIERMQAETERAKQEVIEQARQARVHEIEASVTNMQKQIEEAGMMIKQNQETFKRRFADKSSEAASMDSDQSSFEQDNGFDASFMLKSQLDVQKHQQGELHKRLVEEQQDLKKQILNLIQELRHLEPSHGILQLLDQSKQATQ